MATRIQVRRDTAANWRTSGSTTLAAGEIGFETDTLLFKIGDGSQTWTNLEYAGGTEPIQYNLNGTALADLNDSTVRSGGNGKYLILGAGSVTNGPSGLTTGTDGQLLVTVAKFDYTGTSAANERYLMTLQTLTTGRFFYRMYNGSWSSWYEPIRADPATGNVTLAGDLAVNGGDITTTSTGTATVFNTNATTLNVGQDATTVSIGATTGTATIRNATTAITGAATVGGTLAVTGNTTLTGDLAVNGGDITTTSGTGNVFETNATTVTLGRAATTVCIADNATAAQTIDIGTGATGNGLTKTINIGTGGSTGSTTNVNIGDADGGTVAVKKDMTVGGTFAVTGQTTLTGGLATKLAVLNMAAGTVVKTTLQSFTSLVESGSSQSTLATASRVISYTPALSSSGIILFPIASWSSVANVGFMMANWFQCVGSSNGSFGHQSSFTVTASTGGAITVYGETSVTTGTGTPINATFSNPISQANNSTASRNYTLTASCGTAPQRIFSEPFAVIIIESAA
jgi:hypothetical protein